MLRTAALLALVFVAVPRLSSAQVVRVDPLAIRAEAFPLRITQPLAEPEHPRLALEHRLRAAIPRLGDWGGAVIGALVGGTLAAIPILVVGEKGDSPLEEPIFWIGVGVGALGGLTAEW